MTLERNAAHEAQGVSRLTGEYRGKLKIEGQLKSWLSEVQLLEDTLWALLVERTVDTAVGAQLDVLGRIVKQPRGSRDDDAYRLWIKARVRVNRSSGLPEQIIDILKVLTPDGTAIRVEEQFPAGFVAHIDDAITGSDG